MNEDDIREINSNIDMLLSVLLHIRHYRGRPSVMRSMAARAIQAHCFADDEALSDRRVLGGTLAYEVAVLHQRIEELEKQNAELAAGWAAFDTGSVITDTA